MVSTLADDVKMTCKKVRFYDLEIVTDKASKDGEHLVGFRYKCRVRGQKGFNELAEEKHSELSTFRRGEDGKVAVPRRHNRRGGMSRRNMITMRALRERKAREIMKS